MNKISILQNEGQADLDWRIKSALLNRIINLTFSDPPQVVLRLGSSIDKHNIIEGEDVYFECEIEANPDAYKVECIKNVRLYAFYLVLP